jgi:hypothetical protein
MMIFSAGEILADLTNKTDFRKNPDDDQEMPGGALSPVEG